MGYLSDSVVWRKIWTRSLFHTSAHLVIGFLHIRVIHLYQFKHSKITLDIVKCSLFWASFLFCVSGLPIWYLRYKRNLIRATRLMKAPNIKSIEEKSESRQNISSKTEKFSQKNISRLNSHTSNWFYRINRPFFGRRNFEADHMLGWQLGSQKGLSRLSEILTAMAMIMLGNNESMIIKQFDWLIFSNISTNKNQAWAIRYSSHSCLRINQWAIRI